MTTVYHYEMTVKCEILLCNPSKKIFRVPGESKPLAFFPLFISNILSE